MKVLKFGGSSLAGANQFLNVAEIIKHESKSEQLAVVLSAPQGITDLLVQIADNLTNGKSVNTALDELQQIIEHIRTGLIVSIGESKLSSLNNLLDTSITKLKQLIKGAQLLGHCPEKTRAQILSSGENISIIFLSHIFNCYQLKYSKIDPQLFLITEDSNIEPIADIALSIESFKQEYSSLQPISLMPGFIGTKPDGEITTLGRNGSDYSAAVLAVCSESQVCEIWTDVDGIYNADPRLVEQPQLIQSMSFYEAMELSYFGAKILHPKTIAPLSQYNIPCLIKNSLSPNKAGTLISQKTSNNESAKAISNLNDVAMINVSGPGMKGMVGMASRVFSAISHANISVILISQSSAEYCISFCVPGTESKLAEKCLNKEFSLELKNDLLEPISIKKNLAIISLIGDRMQQQKGIAANFFKSLSQANVNIIAIAQDSSERSISAVVRAQRIDDAVRICYRNLFHQQQTIDAFILGCGSVGQELISQIGKQQQILAQRNIRLDVYGIANSRSILLDQKGIDLSSNWQGKLNQVKQDFSLKTLNEFVSENHLVNPVIIDCTSSEQVSLEYVNFLTHGFHIVTANKKANTMSMGYYKQLREAAKLKHKHFLYETNVGAGLPVINNLQGLLNSGDQLIKFEGVLSGSLSYIFSELQKGGCLSEVTLLARQKGFTEPNPAEDLSGLDVARKVLIIAREIGLSLELSDIELEPVVSKELAKITNTDNFLKQLPSYDETFQAKIEQTKKDNKVLRYIASIENQKCKVSIQAVSPDHPMYNIGNGENALALHTHYYQPYPLVIQGYGAGAKVTAAGVFGDLLRTLTQQ